MIRLVLAMLASALVLAAPGSALPVFGATEDSTKFADDGGAVLYRTLLSLGMTENRITVLWNADEPTTIQGQDFLDRSVPLAADLGIRTIFAIYADRSLTFASNPDERIALFTAYLRQLAERYPQVREYVVGNEPNQPRFWRPQFSPAGATISAAAYEPLLAASYDALKDVDPGIVVIGVGLSPRGNDKPKAKDNRSTSPVRFIAALGKAYRSSGRRAPLMDQLAFHPYPNTNTDPPGKGYPWPNAGVVNLDRIKQAVWDAFHGTAQPTFAEAGRGTSDISRTRPLTFKLDELGWQVGVLPFLKRSYFGRETVPTIDEARQAQFYAELVNLLACDPTVQSILFFHLIDEPDLDRFQSGLLRIDGSRRPAFAAVHWAILGAGACGEPHLWRHTTAAIGARASFIAGSTRIRIGASLEEAGTVQAVVVRAGTRGLEALMNRQPAAPLGPYRTVELKPGGELAPGRYVAAVRFTSEVNPQRTTTIVSRPLPLG